ncbi:MAG: P-loop NTPase fold protein [Clostridia bacterium]
MEELVECICDYVKKPYTDYAIMLNGEWGSGKTYFWNNKLRSRLESISIGNKKYKTIYMSLYGINSLEEISKKIFIETNPMISKTLKKFVDTRQGNLIPEYVKTGLDMANLFGTMQFSSDKVDFSKLFAIDDKILCFDDLERANVDVIDILGYINNFVEHDGIKTIVICNEKELATKFKNTNIEMKTLIATYMLDKEKKLTNKLLEEKVPIRNLLEDKISEIFDKANTYERIKEKLIGETFEYVPEYSYILSGMIMKYSYNDELSEFYKRNTSTIISAFKKSDTRNLRILKHSLSDFETIFGYIVKDYKDISCDILKNILTFTIATSFEIKAGNISKETLRLINSNEEYNSIIFTSKLTNDNSKFYLKDFDNRYFLNTSCNYKFFKFVEIYIRTRYFDEKVFNDNMQEVVNYTDNKVVSNKKYITILDGSYLKLSDTDFDILIRQVLDDIKLGKIEYKDYIRLFIIYKYFVVSELLDVTISDLKNIFILGMQIAAINDNQSESDKIITEDNDVLDIINNYNKIKDKTIDNLAIKNATELFKNVPHNMQDFYSKIMNEYKDIPVFSKYDMDELYSKLDITPNYDLYNITQMVKLRYEDNTKLLKKDIKNLKKLSDIICKNIHNKEKSIKIVLLDNLSKEILKLI